MIIMGIDPSMNCTGWFVFDTNGMTIIDYGYIPNKDLKESDKVLKIYNELLDVFKQYKIEGVGIEEEFFSVNIDTIKKLSHCHGAIILLLSQLNIPFTYYSPLTIKTITLDGMKIKKEDGTKKTGDEMKQEVAAKVFEIFGKVNFIKKYTNDVTDAASAAITYFKLGGKPIEKKSKPKKKRKAK